MPTGVTPSLTSVLAANGVSATIRFGGRGRRAVAEETEGRDQQGRDEQLPHAGTLASITV